MRQLLTVFPAAEQTMFRRYAYRKIGQLTPIVSQTKQIRNCGNSLLKQLIEGDKDFFRDGSLVASSTPGHVKAMVVSRLAIRWRNGQGGERE